MTTDPKTLAKILVDEMSDAQKEEVRQYAAGSWEATISRDLRTVHWQRQQYVECLDEIDRLCGYVEE